MRTPTLLVALLVTAHGAASAQLDARIRMGARVRVNSADAQIIGRVAEVRDDTIVVDRGMGDTTAVSLRETTELAVYARGKGAEAFATTMGVIGAASGAVLYVKWCLSAPDACAILEEDEEECDDDEEDDGFSSPFTTLTMGFAMVGMLIGRALTPPQWHIVDVPVRFGVAPMRDGIGVYVSLPAPRFSRALR